MPPRQFPLVHFHHQRHGECESKRNFLEKVVSTFSAYEKMPFSHWHILHLNRSKAGGRIEWGAMTLCKSGNSFSNSTFSYNSVPFISQPLSGVCTSCFDKKEHRHTICLPEKIEYEKCLFVSFDWIFSMKTFSIHPWLYRLNVLLNIFYSSQI